MCLIGATVSGSAAAQATRNSTSDTASSVLAQWRAESRAARRAYQARDYVANREALGKLLKISPGFPDVMYRLAAAEARLGHEEAALGWLKKFAATGLTRDVIADSDFASLASLRESQGFAEAAKRIARNTVSVSRADTTALLLDPDLLAEDIAYDGASHTFYVSSVRERKIVAIDANGHVTDFTRAGEDGLWSILALAVDPLRRVLWATTSATPMALGYVASDSGHSALLEYDLRTKHLLHRYDPPDGIPNHALGDMTVAPGGDVYVSDGRAGIIYVLRRNHDRLEQLAGPDVFVSPQTPAVTPDGRHVLVADYLRGIASVDVVTGHAEWLAHADSIAVNGIDGLYLVGRTLMAVQNGTAPERIIRLELDPTLSHILRWEAVESNSLGLGDPTHGVVIGSAFYFIANSGWDRFNEDGTLKADVPPSAPSIRVVQLTGIARLHQ